MAKDVTFSVNLNDSDGDAYDECILIHVDDSLIIKFDSLGEYEDFISSLKSMKSEIVEVINQ